MSRRASRGCPVLKSAIADREDEPSLPIRPWPAGVPVNPVYSFAAAPARAPVTNSRVRAQTRLRCSAPRWGTLGCEDGCGRPPDPVSGMADGRRLVRRVGGSARKRRPRAGSFSTYLRHSSSVVTPIVCSSPRASIGLRIDAASIAPSEGGDGEAVAGRRHDRSSPSLPTRPAATTPARALIRGSGHLRASRRRRREWWLGQSVIGAHDHLLLKVCDGFSMAQLQRAVRVTIDRR